MAKIIQLLITIITIATNGFIKFWEIIAQLLSKLK